MFLLFLGGFSFLLALIAQASYQTLIDDPVKLEASERSGISKSRSAAIVEAMSRVCMVENTYLPLLAALIPLATATGVFTPDSSGDDVLFGWADQNVPDLVLCPAATPACTETFHPDGSYDLPEAMYMNPSAPMGLRMDLSSLFIPLQCAMAEPGGVCTGQTNVGCLTDADCGGLVPCDFTVEGVSMPTPDASLLAVPIEDPIP